MRKNQHASKHGKPESIVWDCWQWLVCNMVFYVVWMFIHIKLKHYDKANKARSGSCRCENVLGVGEYCASACHKVQTSQFSEKNFEKFRNQVVALDFVIDCVFMNWKVLLKFRKKRGNFVVKSCQKFRFYGSLGCYCQFLTKFLKKEKKV